MERCPTCGHGFVQAGQIVCVLCEGHRKAAEAARRRQSYPRPTHQ